ncbi:hypothetical protein E2C01_086947 [Portunus trituberculatus]|uniref:Uncharacterized protein n=1 Tax=Portunus trituberculatus TaxID=210409 RepID=A0A5B7JB39_PORTR|nr:hypothetical protein [Portunus trituberculatus]
MRSIQSSPPTTPCIEGSSHRDRIVAAIASNAHLQFTFRVPDVLFFPHQFQNILYIDTTFSNFFHDVTT